MPEYDNTNRGVLFKNNFKKEPKHPDVKGPLNVQGVEYEMAGWVHVNEKGEKRIAISIQPKRENPQTGVPADDFNQDIPF